MRTTALYVNGRVILGTSHLDAFQKLSEDEKNDPSLVSGFYTQSSKEFQGYAEDEHFFCKTIMLLRHGEPDANHLDPGLTKKGVTEVIQAAKYLATKDIHGFAAFTSPFLRCLETARIIQDHIQIDFTVEQDLAECPVFLHSDEEYYIQNRRSAFKSFRWPTEDGWRIRCESPEIFHTRLRKLLHALPDKSILISHRGIVLNIARLALCEKRVRENGVPTASLTYIENQRLKCIGRIPDEDAA